ncbi:MAG: hypothetical protein M3P84_04775 [Chloroflexota bacterium]|nr:hypothetical protein [Chloroflexota bacterium]
MTDEEREPRRGPVQWSSWGWGDEARRPGLPWIGIFLVVFGGLLLLERAVPQFRVVGSTVVVGIGIILLVRWAIERRTAFLYAGAIVTALAIPGALQALGMPANEGLGTLSLGIAFLFIALVRWQSRNGVGWQAWLGAILTVLGGARVAMPQIGDLFLPALLIALGVVVLLRGRDRG